MVKVVKIAGALIVIAIFMGSLAVAWSGLSDHIHPADVGVVLASKVESDGRPKPSLCARLDKTLELYRKGMFPFVIVSGGIDHGWDEAAVMKQYLVGHGVPEERIWADNKGVNTYYTAKNTARFMAGHGMKSVLVITQYFHVPRSRLALERFGVSPVYSAHANFFHVRDLLWVPRDAVGYGYYWLRSYPKDGL